MLVVLIRSSYIFIASPSRSIWYLALISENSTMKPLIFELNIMCNLFWRMVVSGAHSITNEATAFGNDAIQIDGRLVLPIIILFGYLSNALQFIDLNSTICWKTCDSTSDRALARTEI